METNQAADGSGDEDGKEGPEKVEGFEVDRVGRDYQGVAGGIEVDESEFLLKFHEDDAEQQAVDSSDEGYETTFPGEYLSYFVATHAEGAHCLHRVFLFNDKHTQG